MTTPATTVTPGHVLRAAANLIEHYGFHRDFPLAPPADGPELTVIGAIRKAVGQDPAGEEPLNDLALPALRRLALSLRTIRRDLWDYRTKGGKLPDDILTPIAAWACGLDSTGVRAGLELAATADDHHRAQEDATLAKEITLLDDWTLDQLRADLAKCEHSGDMDEWDTIYREHLIARIARVENGELTAPVQP
ncbi:DUF6197 family protein [Herbidospora sp. RD11066]